MSVGAGTAHWRPFLLLATVCARQPGAQPAPTWQVQGEPSWALGSGSPFGQKVGWGATRDPSWAGDHLMAAVPRPLRLLPTLAPTGSREARGGMSEWEGSKGDLLQPVSVHKGQLQGPGVERHFKGVSGPAGGESRSDNRRTAGAGPAHRSAQAQRHWTAGPSRGRGLQVLHWVREGAWPGPVVHRSNPVGARDDGRVWGHKGTCVFWSTWPPEPTSNSRRPEPQASRGPTPRAPCGAPGAVVDAPGLNTKRLKVDGFRPTGANTWPSGENWTSYVHRHLGGQPGPGLGSRWLGCRPPRA